MSDHEGPAHRRQMSLKESVEQIVRSSESAPRHIQVVAGWNRAILAAQRGEPPSAPDRSKR